MRPTVSISRSRTFGAAMLALAVALWLVVSGVASASSQSSAVYDGTMRWQNWSWGTKMATEAVWPIYDGQKSLSVQFTQDWAGLSFATSSFNTSGYTDLAFAMHHNGRGIPSLQAGLYDADGNLIKMVPVVFYAQPGANGWFDVSIPLGDLGATSKKITRVTLQQRHGATVGPFNIAALRFVKPAPAAPSPTPKPPVTDTYTEVVFGDHAEWNDASWDTTWWRDEAGPLHNGNAAIGVYYLEPWAGLSFKADGFISGYANLEFLMHPNGGPIPSLRAVVYGASGEVGMVRVANYITGMSGGWYTVSIPMADLGATGKEIKRITLQEGRGIYPKRTFYVDDLRFTWP